MLRQSSGRHKADVLSPTGRMWRGAKEARREMSTMSTVTIQISDDMRQAIQERMERTGLDEASAVSEILAEAIKMARVPGIIFADGATGRRARVAGTGIEVFEIIGSYRAVGEDWERLRECYDWLSEGQLRAAVTYAETYPDEINARLAREEELTPEYVYAKYPYMKPRDP
jgi:uncharacterized protein (DUF433 family)